MVRIYVSYKARVGAHEVDVTVYDSEEKTALAAGTLIVFVLNDKLQSVAEKIHEYRQVLEQKGVEYTVLKILWDFNQAFKPTEVKAVYEMLLERPVSKGTVYDVLKRLSRKRLVIREPEGYVLNHKLKFYEAAFAVNVKRSLSGRLGARRSKEKNETTAEKESAEKVPVEVKRLLEVASELLERGDYWRAVDLIAHTLIGVRETGQWMLWYDDIFVYFERKTKLAHYFKSSRLAELLRELGLKEGYMGKHVLHPAQKIVRELYGSYPSARRLHYLLKERGWFDYSEYYILEVYFNEQNTPIYISLKDATTDAELYGYGTRTEESDKRIRLIVIPGEHVDKENEEMYFHRPAGLY